MRPHFLLDGAQIGARLVDERSVVLGGVVEEVAQVGRRRRQIAELALRRRRVDQELWAGKEHVGGAKVGERRAQVTLFEQLIALRQQHARLLLLRRLFVSSRAGGDDRYDEGNARNGANASKS